MTIAADFQTKADMTVVIGTEVTTGTATLAAGVTCEIPVTDFSFDEIHKHSLNVAPSRTGGGAFTQSDQMVRWQRHDSVWDISITFHATAQSIDRVCLALFEDGATPNVLQGDMPDTTSFKHGVANIVPVTMYFENASHAGLNTDMYFTSCLCTGLTFSGDIAGNGGVVLCTATFQTGYQPTEGALTFSGGTHTLVSAQTTTFNMHDLTTETLNSEDILLYSFELAIARPVNRVGFDPDNSYRPLGYSLGGYEVTGSLTCKRDSESTDAIDTSTAVALDLDTGVFQITAPKVYVDGAAISFDDDVWKQTIPFRCTYSQSGGITSTIVSIGTTA